MADNGKQIAMRVSIVSVAVNMLLSVLKLAAGLIAHSGAMVSDAVHSASDVFSTFVVMIGVHMASKEADEEHPYGHERMECVAAIVLAAVLFATGLAIGYAGLNQLLSGYEEIKAPGALALLAAVVSIGVKEWMYWYTVLAAKKINSGALKADAWHHRSDALSSVGALLGIAGARMGYPFLDCVASVVICAFVIKAAYDIFKDAVDKMLDTACDKDTVKKLQKIILNQPGVLGISKLTTRIFGSKVYVDVEIEADGDMTLRAAHEVAENVHHAIERGASDVKHCMVHVNPRRV
ncbi:cation diffusion facilitator family transporter [Lachnospiraceae bacterium MD308]|nr:cation diffusion facilitator family transporter [Lachnospiraceae bacterium MD308]